MKRRELPEAAAGRTCRPDEHTVRPEAVPTCVESVSPTGDHILLAFGVCRWCAADMLGVISANERESTASWAAWIDVMHEADTQPEGRRVDAGPRATGPIGDAKRLDTRRRDSPRTGTAPRDRWLKVAREP